MAGVNRHLPTFHRYLNLRQKMMRLAELHAEHTPETYAYLFTWQSPGWDGKLGAAQAL